ncbi:MAG: Na+/H+ antiporter NhaC family protein [Clostridia bacterium]|nr:Na+/H+ antiporter NhaC family protein [Clostridia bacterium]
MPKKESSIVQKLGVSGIIAAIFIVVFAIACAVQSSIFNPVGTMWSLFPPVVAIGLALITKEVYSSLFIGLLVGAIISANFKFAPAMDIIINDGLVSAVSGTAGIFLFLVFLGIIVSLLNKSGGSAAFGRWAQTHIKTRVGAMLATFALGVLIFVDDYFNCLTVGAVMKPITDSHKISRAKFSYLIDATAAPICMIAPISSWAAAVSQYAEGTDVSGIKLFCMAIPYNYYSLLTLVFIIAISIMRFDYGPMKRHELNAILNGDLYTEGERVPEEDTVQNPNSKLLDLILPVVVLIALCVLAMLYVGGFFSGVNFVDAFSDTDATVALPWGALLALIFTMIYFIARKAITFKETMESIASGFNAMISPIVILTLAISLKNATGLLDSSAFVEGVMEGVAGNLAAFLPAVIFVVATLIAFATGTSWGTFGILIPIVITVFKDPSNPLFLIGISACLAGSVCGDHISPISDTTIMSSAGAQSNHLNHVSTQIPYALTVAGISFLTFIIAGFIQNAIICLALGAAFVLLTLVVLKAKLGKDANEAYLKFEEENKSE